MSKITHLKGDLFAAPRHCILVHACNTVGSWGAGIALTFRSRYPAAFEAYKAHCKAHGAALLGTCLLIPGEEHDIACLFTSRAYGGRKDAPGDILRATGAALRDLARLNAGGRPLHACRFNSGKFGVPWEDTQAVLDDLGVEMTVYEFEQAPRS